jgi:hypothetical protein
MNKHEPIPPEPRLSEGDAERMLQREWQTFQRQLAPLLAAGNEGRFALIKEDHLVGVWDTEDAALHAGFERFGLDPFLVQPITSHEPAFRSGMGWRCRT